LKKFLKDVKWLNANLSSKTFKRNLLIDIGLLAYAFKSFSWESVLKAVPFFLAFLFICVLFSLMVSIGDRSAESYYKKGRWGKGL
jgi:hypothetical protein